MSSVSGGGPVERLHADLDDLLAADVVGLPDPTLRSELLGLLAAQDRLHAAITDRLASFDTRDLGGGDACRTSVVWLVAFGRRSAAAAAGLVKRARLLRRLPRLHEAAARGDASAEHVDRVSRLAAQVGTDALVPADQTLADAATALPPADFGRVCGRIRDHLDPDGPDPDPKALFDKRQLTLSDLHGMVVLHGQLDPEGGAALREALDALMRPPGPGDERSPAQRRADALVDLARGALAGRHLPTVGGMRPQVGILLSPQTLFGDQHAPGQHGPGQHGPGQHGPGQHGPGDPRTWTHRPTDDTTPDDSRPDDTRPDDTRPDDIRRYFTRAGGDVDQAEAHDHPDETRVGAARGDPPHDDPPHDDPPPDARGDPPGGGPRGDPPDEPRGDPPDAAPGDPLTQAGGGPPVEPAWLNWYGPIAPALAQRLACDADIWRIVLDPATGLPLDVGRAHRLVPWWIRRALHARDRGCRWPGCPTPAPWTDSHHLKDWYHHGVTRAEDLLSLCRYHHHLVHEGQWGIRLDRGTGQVHVTRPDGTDYEIGPSHPWTRPTTRRDDHDLPDAA